MKKNKEINKEINKENKGKSKRKNKVNSKGNKGNKVNKGNKGNKGNMVNNKGKIDLDASIIYGKNSVLETLLADIEVNKLVAQNDSKDHTVQKIVNICKDRKIPIRFVDKSEFERTHRGVNHQGVLLYTAPYKYSDIEDMVQIAKDKGEAPLIVLCDGITDPHNLGGIIRSANCGGAHGVVITKRDSAAVTDTVVKTSSGAVQYTPVARVSNLVQTIEKLKKMGLWIVGTDFESKSIHNTLMDGPLAIVIGSEGEGIGRLVKEKCDILTTIPMKGQVGSLNASVAAGVVLYEVIRQRLC